MSHISKEKIKGYLKRDEKILVYVFLQLYLNILLNIMRELYII